MEFYSLRCQVILHKKEKRRTIAPCFLVVGDVDSGGFTSFVVGMKNIQGSYIIWSAASAAVASPQPESGVIFSGNPACGARTAVKNRTLFTQLTSINNLTAAGQTAGVGPDGSIVVIPQQCVPRGVSLVKLVGTAGRSQAQRRAVWKQKLLLGLWSQTRVGVVLAFSFAMPFALADYGGAPPLPARARPTTVPVFGTASAHGSNSAVYRAAAAPAEEKDGSWLGWSIWGGCRKPQHSFDPGSEKTIESFGAFSPSSKLARDKEAFVGCITDAFGTRCSHGVSYAVAATGDAESNSRDYLVGLANG